MTQSGDNVFVPAGVVVEADFVSEGWRVPPGRLWLARDWEAKIEHDREVMRAEILGELTKERDDFLRRKVKEAKEAEMPLRRGTGKATVSSNIREFHKGATYAATRKKFGAKRANKQAVAVAMAEKRKSRR